jgi:hypothetical protein
VGTQFVLFTFTYQSGDVLTDASLPLQDVRVKLNVGSVAYGRTFGIARRQANAMVLFNYVKGRASGTVFEEQQAITRSGLSDMRVRFSMNLIGGPALTPQEFAAYKARTLIGTSLTIIAPTGQYDPNRLVNIGSNRWSFKPEIGLSTPVGRWTLEVAGGVWLFTPNNNFFGGLRREQRPIVSVQASVIYTIRRRMWVSGNATYYTGGGTVINGVDKETEQKNSRGGVTFSWPLSQRQSIKVVWAKGLTARFGGNLNTISVGWQYAWVK